MKFDNSFFSYYIICIKHVMRSIVYVPCLRKGDQSNVMLTKDVSSHIRMDRSSFTGGSYIGR